MIIQRGDEKIIIQREVYDAKSRITNRDGIDARISAAFQAVESDVSITAFGITPDIKDKRLLAKFPRSDFPALSRRVVYLEPEEAISDEQSLIERTDFADYTSGI